MLSTQALPEDDLPYITTPRTPTFIKKIIKGNRMDIFIYDAKSDLGLGKLVKTKNGILVKAFYGASIAKHCKNWDDVVVVDMIESLVDFVGVFFACTEAVDGGLPEAAREILNNNVDPTDSTCCVRILVDEKTTNIVVGPSLSQCLDVCLFHGFNNVTVPKNFQYCDLSECQKKLFHKIFVRS